MWFCCPAMELRVCRYLNWRVAGDSSIMLAASRSTRAAFCSPSADTTFIGENRRENRLMLEDRRNIYILVNG